MFILINLCCYFSTLKHTKTSWTFWNWHNFKFNFHWIIQPNNKDDQYLLGGFWLQFNKMCSHVAQYSSHLFIWNSWSWQGICSQELTAHSSHLFIGNSWSWQGICSQELSAHSSFGFVLVVNTLLCLVVTLQ